MTDIPVKYLKLERYFEYGLFEDLHDLYVNLTILILICNLNIENRNKIY